VKLSKAMRNVDAETRAIVRNARLDALEADNYGEDEADAGDGVDAHDDLYVEEDASEPSRGKPKKPKAKLASKTKRYVASPPSLLQHHWLMDSVLY
jgi:hypothetical protein